MTPLTWTCFAVAVLAAAAACLVCWRTQRACSAKVTAEVWADDVRYDIEVIGTPASAAATARHSARYLAGDHDTPTLETTEEIRS